MARRHLSQLLNGVTRFGRLTVIGDALDYQWGSKRYRMAACRCDCGALRAVSPSKLRSGETVSCGCYAADRASSGNRKHGMTNSPEYHSWLAMKQRCYSPNATGFKNYGGRGIAICDRWRERFENFYADMGPRPSLGHSLDRIDVNGNYEPSNCRWATTYEQGDNTRATHRVEVAGKAVNLSELSRLTGLSRSALRQRMKRGMSPEQAASVPRQDSRAP